MCPSGQTDPSTIDQAAATAALVHRTAVIRTVVGVVLVGSVVASAYHGYKRNLNSPGWALGWGASGFLFPLVTPVVAIIQGYGEPHHPERSNPSGYLPYRGYR